MQLVGLQAAAVSTLAGTLASLPFSLVVDGGWGLGTLLSQGGIVLSCLLFGVTYRYIIRRDLGNLQLKSGAVAGFGLVRGKKTQCYCSLCSGQFLIPPSAASYAPRFARLLNSVLLIEHMKTMCKMSKWTSQCSYWLTALHTTFSLYILLLLYRAKVQVVVCRYWSNWCNTSIGRISRDRNWQSFNSCFGSWRKYDNLCICSTSCRLLSPWEIGKSIPFSKATWILIKPVL